MEDGLLYYKNRLFIPSKEELLTEIVKQCQDSKGADISDKKKQSNSSRETSAGKNSEMDQRLYLVL